MDADAREPIDASPLATPRYELVDGDLLVTPSPRVAHQEAVAVFVDGAAQNHSQTDLGYRSLVAEQ